MEIASVTHGSTTATHGFRSIPQPPRPHAWDQPSRSIPPAVGRCCSAAPTPPVRTADTWTWDGTNWTQMATSTAPYPRLWASMAFDSQRGQTVMFGGDHIQPYGLGATNDTWDWDGAQWSRDWTGAAPAIRAGQTMSFDSRRDRMVMFGGNNAAVSPATLYGDTWELGTGTITPAGSPAMTVTPSSMGFGSVDLGATS